jgi:hypothetical protein
MMWLFHPTSCDNNGNFGPGERSRGWFILNAHIAEDAVKQLPRSFEDLVYRTMRKHGKNSIRDMIEDTAGWGLPFTLLCVDYGEADDMPDLLKMFNP